METAEEEEIYSVNFNQDNECFVLSTSHGIRVFCTDEFGVTFLRDFEGGIKLADLLFRTNIIGFVGTGANPAYPSTRFVLWDDVQLRPFGELDFKTDVLNVKLRRDYVVAVLAEKIYVYTLNNLETFDSFITCSNPLGLVALSPNLPDSKSCVLAFPDKEVGKVSIVDYSRGEGQLFTMGAHNTALAAIKLSQDGTILATCSGKGTLIRLFDTEKCTMIQEVRRGTVTAVITDITIDKTNTMCACASDQGTIHLYKIGEENKKSNFSALSAVSSFFSSQWSTAQLRTGDQACKIALLNGKIFAISRSGKYYMAENLTDPSGALKVSKECDMLEESKNVEEQTGA